MDIKNKKNRKLIHSKGVTYFGRDTERSFFFALTGVMLVLGIIAKLGLF